MDFWPFWEIIVNALEFGGVIAFLSIQLKVDKNKKCWLFVGYAAALILISCLNLIDIQMNIELFGTITIYISRLISFSTLFLFCYFILEGSISEKFVWACLPPLVMSFSDFVSFQAMRLITEGTLEDVTQFGHSRLFTTLIYLLVSALIYLSIIYFQRKKNRADILLLTHLRILLIFILVLGTIAIDQLIDISFFSDELSSFALEIKSLFISASFFVILLSVFVLILRIGKLTIDLLHAQRNKIILQNFEELERSYNAIRTAKHEINNHLKTLNGLNATRNYEDLGEYLEGLVGEYETAQAVLTGNLPLDVLLSNKLAVAQAHNIKFSYKTRNVESLNIPYTSICSIVGNLLDNAIEACLRLSENSERTINFKILKKEQMLNITVVNTSNGCYRKNSDTFLSSKAGSMNGLGLKICHDAVKRCGGFMYIDACKNSFQVAITIPLDAFQ